MKKYKAVFFDLDHTLWDYEKNSAETLTELFYEYHIDKRPKVDLNSFLITFDKVNEKLWSNYNKGHIDRDAIRDQRFKRIFREFGIRHDPMAITISDEYIKRCPTKTHLMPFTISTLDYLKTRYELHILSNGFNDVQGVKLDTSGLKNYFKHIITSESSGHRKPSKEIFDFSLSLANVSATEAIMIGDNLNADILGAQKANIDHVFFNPSKQVHKQSVTHEIDCLSQLHDIL